MSRKILVILFVLLIPICLTAETGVGAAFFFNLSNLDGLDGAALNISHPVIPGTILGVRAQFADESFSIGVYDDWWLYRTHLAGAVSLYLGPGFFFNVSNAGGESQVDFGGRLPIGLQFFPIKPIELFIEIAPTLGVLPTLPTFGVQGALGIRFWF